MGEREFDDIRPYSDEEIREAIPRIISDSTFHSMMDYLFTPDRKENIISNV